MSEKILDTVAANCDGDRVLQDLLKTLLQEEMRHAGRMYWFDNFFKGALADAAEKWEAK